MNTDQQQYYPNQAGSHPPTHNVYMHTMDSQYSMRNPNAYGAGARMPHTYYNPPIANNYPQAPMIYSGPYGQPTASFLHSNNPRGINPNSISIIRPPNETQNGTQPFSPQQQQYATYPNTNIYQTINPYSHSSYNAYPQQPIYTQGPTQLSNQTQPQYPVAGSQQAAQLTQTSQQSSEHQPDSSTFSSQSNAKRTRTPLKIVNPETHKPVEINTSTSSTNESSANNSSTTLITDENRHQKSTTDSTITNSKSTDDVNKEKQNEKFRKQFAELLNTNDQLDKNTNKTSRKENQNEDVTPESTASAASSSSFQSEPIPDETPDQDQSDRLDVDTKKKTDDQDDTTENSAKAPSNNEGSINDLPIEIPTVISPTPSVEKVPSEPSNDSETEPIITNKSSSTSKRRNYTIEELRNKRNDPKSQERPRNLPFIPDVIIQQINKPNEQFFRDVTSILNKITPQTYDNLLKQLENLEVNSSERLEGMISIIFTKAVEAAIFCPLYANICKNFRKKEVTVPNESGQMVTYTFRQFLLSRCQKEFEGDYRQEINYEKRKSEVEAITDEKRQREAAEQLEEDLFKAKRKKLGNIIFIGELFKLQMLIDTIMYDCIEYLLKDKTDEESLECLCRLLRTMGKELDAKAAEKSTNRKNLEKHYTELENITTQRQTSARMRFMIQDVLEQRKADWVARRAEVKPLTIDEIHEQERLKREQQEREQERERQQRRDQNRYSGQNNPQQYTGSRGSRGSGMKQQSNRTDDHQSDNRLANTLRQLQSSDKRNSAMPLNLAPQSTWSKGSGVDKKPEDDRSNAPRTNKPPAGLNQQFRPKFSTSSGAPYHQRQPSRELARENSPRDREKALDSLRRTTSKDGSNKPINTSVTDSREGSRNVSREQSRTASPESTISERTSVTNKPTTTTTTTENNSEGANTPFNEEKIQTRVHSLIEEYTENYSDNSERPVNDAIEDLSSFCTKVVDQQGFIVRELITNVLEAKARARKAVGHLLDAALHKNIISNEGFLSGLKMFMEIVPDYAVDIPLIWQYIGEILGAFIGGQLSNMTYFKSIFQLIPDAKSKQLFQDIIRYAIEFSSEANIQQSWQSADLSLHDFIESDSNDSSFVNEHPWLSETTTTEINENLAPRADPHLIKLFKSINDQSTAVTDDEILTYIRDNMNSEDKYYIRNIVLSYLEACLVTRDAQKKIQEDIAKKRMSVLNQVMHRRPEDEVQAVYAIQNFVNKLEHPLKMARLLFDIFYDEDCVGEEAFLQWLRQPDPSETEGHSVVEMSTQDFFTWLQQADTEGEGEEEEEEEE